MVHPVNFDDQKGTHSKRSEEQRSSVGSHVADKDVNRKRNKSFSAIKPETTHSLFLRGCARLELKRYLETRKAISDFTQCMELLSPNTSPTFTCELFYKRASAYQYIGRNNEAIKDYTESINRSRSLNEQGKILLLNNLLGRGQTYQAMYKLRMAFIDIDAANRMTGYTDAYCLCCRAGVYTAQRDYRRAVDDLDKAAKMGCDQNLVALLERASVLHEMGKHDVALPDLEKALTICHENIQKGDIYYLRGNCDYALKNKDQALHSFEQAVKMNPYHGKAYFRIGMIQAEKGKLKEALRTLTKAHELAPHQRDILLERAIINRKLGNANDAEEDVNRGMQLSSSTVSTTTTLESYIKRIREEIRRNGPSTRTHLELAMAYDGLLSQEQESEVQAENYKEAVTEYRAAIESDTTITYPQARALLALCHNKMNDIILAHEWHLEFYDILFEYKHAEQHWKAYVKDISEKMESSNLDPHLDENAVRKLMHMERNRKIRSIDEENYTNDTEDQYKNQLAFYLHLRSDLSNVLAAIALSNLDDNSITENLRSTRSRVGNIVELFSGNSGFVPEIESVLSGDVKASKKVFRKADFEKIESRLKLIGSVGDITDQIEVAQLVARHMCTRYRSQLICLKPNGDSNIHSTKTVEKVSPPKSSWNCCSRQAPLIRQSNISSNGNETIGQITTFAVAFIIHAIIHEKTRSSTSENLSRREALASMLVLIICRATRSSDASLFQSITFNEKKNLLIEEKILLKMLGRSKQVINENKSPPIEWDLYDFFQGPGIYYHSDDKPEKTSYYGSGSSMKPHIYGYRLGTEEEIDVFDS